MSYKTEEKGAQARGNIRWSAEAGRRVHERIERKIAKRTRKHIDSMVA